MRLRLLLAALLLVAWLPAFAQVATNSAPLEFTSQAEEERFHALVGDCLLYTSPSPRD